MRILLVEDDIRISNFVAKGLRESSYAVDTAANGLDVLYQISINDYDLIILDVMLPQKSGFEVCRELRKKGIKTPVLMLTARDAVEDKITGLDFGADDYLTKPFAFDELLARLRALLRRNKEIRPPKIVVGDLEIDTAAQRIRRGGREIPLTTKEYALLEYLARERGRVVGRSFDCRGHGRAKFADRAKASALSGVFDYQTARARLLRAIGQWRDFGFWIW